MIKTIHINSKYVKPIIFDFTTNSTDEYYADFESGISLKNIIIGRQFITDINNHILQSIKDEVLLGYTVDEIYSGIISGHFIDILRESEYILEIVKDRVNYSLMYKITNSIIEYFEIYNYNTNSKVIASINCEEELCTVDIEEYLHNVTKKHIALVPSKYVKFIDILKFVLDKKDILKYEESVDNIKNIISFMYGISILDGEGLKDILNNIDSLNKNMISNKMVIIYNYDESLDEIESKMIYDILSKNKSQIILTSTKYKNIKTDMFSHNNIYIVEPDEESIMINKFKDYDIEAKDRILENIKYE